MNRSIDRQYSARQYRFAGCLLASFAVLATLGCGTKPASEYRTYADMARHKEQLSDSAAPAAEPPASNGFLAVVSATGSTGESNPSAAATTPSPSATGSAPAPA